MDKITYPDKQTAVNPASPAANEIFTAANANQIKTVVNAIVDAFDTTTRAVSNPTTVELTALDLETEYPDAGLDFTVLCEDIPDNPIKYTKGATTWYSQPLGSTL